MDTDSWSGKHPDLWNRHDVQQWLQWCMVEYALSDINLERFNMNGKALCMLTKDNFCDRVPEVGDVLYNTLVKLLEEFHEQHHHFRQGPMDLRHTPIPMTVTSYQCTCDDSQSDNKYGVQIHGRHECRRQSQDVFVPSPRSRPGYPYEGPDPFRSTEDIKPLDLTLTTLTAAKEEEEDDHDRFPTPPHSACELPDTSAPSEQRGSKFGSLIPHTAEEEEEKEEEEQRAYSAGADTSRLSPQTPPVPVGLANVIGNTGQIFSILNDPIQMKTVSTANSDCRLLWEFLHELLKDSSQYARLVRWENESKYMFRICSPNGLARLWGLQKNRSKMTYEKLARALRYYYKVRIITKVPGRRLTYRFLVPPDEIRKGVRGAKPGVPHVRRQRQSNDASPTQSNLGTHSETGSDVISATSTTTNFGQQPMEGLEIRTSWHDSTRENTRGSPGRTPLKIPTAHRKEAVAPLPADCAQAIRQASAVVNDSISSALSQNDTVCYESTNHQLTTFDECSDSHSPKHEYDNNNNNTTNIKSNTIGNDSNSNVNTFMPLFVVSPTTETGELGGH